MKMNGKSAGLHLGDMDVEALDISGKALLWYGLHKRDLPWRETRDPYRIWISEIILQQTRVAQGLDYYRRFVERYPDVAALAASSEQDLLKLWQGLGYYSRARNMHEAARMIMDAYGGVFPVEYKDVIRLKGVGSYTAAAIVSIAYGAPYSVVDGNVLRVLSRLFLIDEPIDTAKGKQICDALASRIMNPQEAALHNQAMMEIGALQCVPMHPDCTVCPFTSVCMAFAQDAVGDYPKKSHATPVRDRFLFYLYIHCGDSVWIRHRVENDIWKGLYDFPSIPLDRESEDEQLLKVAALFLDGCGALTFEGAPVRMIHKLTHRTLHVAFLSVRIVYPSDKLHSFIRIEAEQLERYPMPKLLDNYLNNCKR